MKKVFSLLLILCMLLPAAALGEEKLPSVRFTEANYVGYLDVDCKISLKVALYGYAAEGKTLELRDQHNRVLSTLEYKENETVTFQLKFDESLLGGHDLSVWCDRQKISSNSTYLAVGDRHRKAVVKAETPENWISITISCTGEDRQTNAILKVLEENNVKATFFFTGDFVNASLWNAKKIRDAGHEIGSSGMTERYLTRLNLNGRFNQVRNGGKVIRQKLGVIPRLFLPPYYNFDASISTPARAEGMEVVLYTINSMDTDKKYAYNTKPVMKRITQNVEPGSIIAFHLDGYNTAQLLAEALPYYRDTLQLSVVPLSQLITSAGIEIPPCPYEEMPVQVVTNVF